MPPTTGTFSVSTGGKLELTGATSGPRRCAPLTDDSDLHLLVDGRRIDPAERSGERYAFRLTAQPRSVRIRSRAAVPQELGVARDARCLGVALRRIVLAQPRRQQAIEANASALADGWHTYEPDDGVRWTDGDAAIPAQLFARMSSAGMLVLLTGPTTQYIDDGTAAAAA